MTAKETESGAEKPEQGPAVYNLQLTRFCRQYDGPP